MRGPHNGRMCFRSVKTLGALHSLAVEKASDSAFSTAKNVPRTHAHGIVTYRDFY